MQERPEPEQIPVSIVSTPLDQLTAANVIEAAFTAYAAGLAVMPPKEDGTKAPSGNWKQYQRQRPSESTLRTWYVSGSRSGVGLLTGAVSDNLEVVDFDSRDVYRAFRELATATGLSDLVERIEAGYLEETPNGMHWAYKCDATGGNTKLARRPKLLSEMKHPGDKVQTLIETRGQGGFVIVAPSHGPIHPSGKPYRLQRGGFNTIARVTKHERRLLHDLARSFDQMPKASVAPSTRKDDLQRERPGDIFNDQASWPDLLTKHGWCRVYQRDGVTFWRRPGKDIGVSATTNYAGSNLLYVFSSSTPFEPDTSYSPFAAYAVLEHGGDYKAAAKELAANIQPSEDALPASGDVIVSAPSNPMAVAREFVAATFTQDNNLLLRHHNGDFFRYSGGIWPEYEDRGLRGELYHWLEAAVYWKQTKEGTELAPWNPNVRKVNDVVDALKAVGHLPASVSPPAWIAGAPSLRPRSPRTGALFNLQSDILPMANGLLTVSSRELIPHTPAFFSHNKLAFDFDPEAPLPSRWLRFLAQLWPEDKEAIGALQEVIGYLLAGGTSLQKIFLIVGPKRSGKGTIGRVLTGLLGSHNVAAPTLASLGTNFGLQPLIGVPLALISDARLGTKTDSAIVVERLLSISGEDSITIDRKYRDPWTGRLPTRFLVLSNELPRLTDSSGALASRFVLFVLTESFYGNENPRLTDELLAEAPGIFNWALDGLDRLAERGYLKVPGSSEEAISQFEDLASPVGAFIRTHCVYKSDLEVPVDDLWLAWKSWCEDQNRPPGTKASFGKDFKAFSPSTPRVRSGGENRIYVYRGVGLSKQNNGQALGLLRRGSGRPLLDGQPMSGGSGLEPDPVTGCCVCGAPADTCGPNMEPLCQGHFAILERSPASLKALQMGAQLLTIQSAPRGTEVTL